MPQSESKEGLPAKAPLLILCGAAHAQKAALADLLVKVRSSRVLRNNMQLADISCVLGYACEQMQQFCCNSAGIPKYSLEALKLSNKD